MKGRLIDYPYGVLGTATDLISVTPTYCLKEPMESGLRRGAPCADPLRSPIRDDWRRERGWPRGFKGLARKLTQIFFNLLYLLRICFFFSSSSSKTRDRGYEDSRTSRIKREQLRRPLKDGVTESAIQPL
ncbi:hypothetical protein TNCV_2896581 [Trichonephila clavipes]|nr:hypothetical protein TNCV_2896581 [Trichonephila clavipes]